MESAEKSYKLPVKKSSKIQFIPHEESEWRDRVAGHAKDIDPEFTKEKAVPVSSHSVPDSDELRQVNAVRTDAEPLADVTGADISHTLNTLGAQIGGGSNNMHDRSTSGKDAVTLMKDKQRRT